MTGVKTLSELFREVYINNSDPFDYTHRLTYYIDLDNPLIKDIKKSRIVNVTRKHYWTRGWQDGMSLVEDAICELDLHKYEIVSILSYENYQDFYKVIGKHDTANKIDKLLDKYYVDQQYWNRVV